MAQEEKELLLIDLCARLPHGVIVHCENGDGKFDGVLYSVMGDNVLIKTKRKHGVTPNIDCKVDSVKPYLRPMSSMTEEEYKEAKTNGCIIYHDTSPKNRGLMVTASPEGFDWLNKKMFAYRTINGMDMFGLGLALKALEEIYSLKK